MFAKAHSGACWKRILGDLLATLLHDFQMCRICRYLENIAQKLFNGDVDVAAHRVLKDYRSGKLGNFSLEKPPRTYR